MEYKPKWYRRAEFVCMLFAIILQIVSLTAPGWQILVHGNNEQYTGLFYVTECHKDDCESKSKHNIYHDIVANSTDFTKSERLILDREYHEDIEEQVLMVVIFVTTFIAFIVQFYKLRHRHVHFPRLTAITVPYLAINCGLILKIVIDDFIEIDYMIEVTKSDYRDNRYVGFPYCIVTYIAAFVFMKIAILLYVAEICKLSQKPPKPPPKRFVEDDIDNRKMNPISQRTDSLASTDGGKIEPNPQRNDSVASTGFNVALVSQRNASMGSYGVDNVAYDVKL